MTNKEKFDVILALILVLVVFTVLTIIGYSLMNSIMVPISFGILYCVVVVAVFTNKEPEV